MPSVRDFIVLERPAWEESKVVVYGQSETLCFWFLVHSESLVHARTFWRCLQCMVLASSLCTVLFTILVGEFFILSDS